MSEIQVLILFTVWMMELWHRLLREVVGCPPLEMFKSIWTLSWAARSRWLCLSTWVDHVQRSIPFCHSVQVISLPGANQDLP